MTPETKGQPEPVASIVHDTLHDHRWATRGDPPEKADPDRYTIRPLYDYDVPALLEQKENLVEALEWVEWTRGVGPFCPACCNRKVHGHRHDCSTEAALAAAREES